MDWIEKQIHFPNEKDKYEDEKAKTFDSLSITCEDGLDYHYLSAETTSVELHTYCSNDPQT
ncbi:hypothetical protein [Sulfurimonas sp.]|uniref:hypothetical protein n=1 Tax=Sulfurimonas sp. TaxID=2022749 RepID=UPI0035648556